MSSVFLSGSGNAMNEFEGSKWKLVRVEYVDETFLSFNAQSYFYFE